MKQLTEKQAIALAESGVWREWDDEKKALTGLMQNKLCLPFDEFHKAIEAHLGRPVWTHEFGLNRKGLIQEALGGKEAPSFDEIVGLIPAEKLILINLPEKGDNNDDN